MKISLILTALTLILFSCSSEKSDDCGDPVSSICTLILVDQSGNPLVGTLYQADSIRLFTPSQNIPLDCSNGAIHFNFFNLKALNQENILLKLSQNETDTLTLFIRTTQSECWTTQHLDTLKYNKQLIAPISMDAYKIIK